MASDPRLLKAWLEKNDGATALKVFKQEFEEFKANRLFDKLPELHRLWKVFSEFGSHTNINSVVSRFGIRESSTHLEYLLNYTGAEPNFLVQALFEMILASYVMEVALFNLCRDRLKLDLAIPNMRTEFEREKERVRRHIIKIFNITPPQGAP